MRYTFARSIFSTQIDREKSFKLRANEKFITYHAGDIVSLITTEDTKALVNEGFSIDDLFDYCLDNNLNGIYDKVVGEVHFFDSRHSKNKLNKEQKNYYFDLDAALRNGKKLVSTFKEDKISKFDWFVVVSLVHVGTGEVVEVILFDEHWRD